MVLEQSPQPIIIPDRHRHQLSHWRLPPLLLELDHHHDVKGLMIIIVFDTNLIYLTLFKVHLQLMYRLGQ